MEAQPTTPLRAVVFCISDASLSDEDLEQFIPITILLLRAGANSRPARELAIMRYGEHHPRKDDSPFNKVLDLIFVNS